MGDFLRRAESRGGFKKQQEFNLGVMGGPRGTEDRQCLGIPLISFPRGSQDTNIPSSLKIPMLRYHLRLIFIILLSPSILICKRGIIMLT